MTRAAEPDAPTRATVSHLDAARRRRAASAGPAPAGEDDAPTVSAPARRRRDPANRRFDAAKVERLRGEIERGTYDIDCWSVADRFIEHERNRR